jgi:hypothetical protein
LKRAPNLGSMRPRERNAVKGAKEADSGTIHKGSQVGEPGSAEGQTGRCRPLIAPPRLQVKIIGSGV